MKRKLLPSVAFNRLAKKLTKRQPQVATSLLSTLELLSDDAFQPSLKTHKLLGKWAGCWSASAGYDLRIIFELVTFAGTEAILLQSIGTHDEVY